MISPAHFPNIAKAHELHLVVDDAKLFSAGKKVALTRGGVENSVEEAEEIDVGLIGQLSSMFRNFFGMAERGLSPISTEFPISTESLMASSTLPHPTRILLGIPDLFFFFFKHLNHRFFFIQVPPYKKP